MWASAAADWGERRDIWEGIYMIYLIRQRLPYSHTAIKLGFRVEPRREERCWGKRRRNKEVREGVKAQEQENREEKEKTREARR